MTIPRGWAAIEMQRDPQQQATIAEPVATDMRFKAAAFLLFFAWLVICFSLWHSLHHYKPRSRGLFSSFVGFFKFTPIKFILTIPLALVVVAYEAACAFEFSVSPLKLGGNNSWIFGMGFTPVALIVLVQEVYGYIDPNEDRELIRQRRVRGLEIDAEMGYTRKPAWWSRLHGDQNLSVSSAITKNVREVAGRRDGSTEQNIEMHNIPPYPRVGGPEKTSSHGKPIPETVRVGASLLFPNASGGVTERSDQLSDSRDRGRLRDETVRNKTVSTTRGTSERSTSTASGGTLNAPPQQIRSMLDV